MIQTSGDWALPLHGIRCVAFGFPDFLCCQACIPQTREGLSEDTVKEAEGRRLGFKLVLHETDAAVALGVGSYMLTAVNTVAPSEQAHS